MTNLKREGPKLIFNKDCLEQIAQLWKLVKLVTG